jgi:hypothetical protein
MEFRRAEDEVRTRDLNLCKVALYQLSYFRKYINDPKSFRGAKIANTAFSMKFDYLYWGV